MGTYEGRDRRAMTPLPSRRITALAVTDTVYAEEEGEEALRAMQIPDFIGPEAQEHAVDLAWAVLGALALVIGVVNYLGRRKGR
jgi:hypothetical protein